MSCCLLTRHLYESLTGIAKLQINTDSQFLIKCITQWLPKWQKNGWKVSDGGDVKNKVQLVDLHQAMKANIDIKWVLFRLKLVINDGSYSTIIFLQTELRQGS